MRIPGSRRLSPLVVALSVVAGVLAVSPGLAQEGAVADEAGAITAPLTVVPGMYVKNGGLVGVGTDNPAVALHVNSNATSVIRMQNAGGVRLEFRDTANDVQWDFRTTSGNTFTIARLKPTAVNIMSALSNGDLKILGSLKTQNGVNTYPDFVFEDGYSLMPLPELAAFIDREKHLPDVLSTADVQSEGAIDVTQLQLQLLRKVEELTLYTLEQQRYIEGLESRLAQLEAPRPSGGEVTSP